MVDGMITSSKLGSYIYTYLYIYISIHTHTHTILEYFWYNHLFDSYSGLRIYINDFLRNSLIYSFNGGTIISYLILSENISSSIALAS